MGQIVVARGLHRSKIGNNQAGVLLYVQQIYYGADWCRHYRRFDDQSPSGDFMKDYRVF